MVFGAIKKGFVKARSAWRNTLIGGKITRLYREKVGHWWFLSFYEPVRTAMMEEGNTKSIGRSVNFGKGGDRYPYWMIPIETPWAKLDASGKGGRSAADKTESERLLRACQTYVTQNAAKYTTQQARGATNSFVNNYEQIQKFIEHYTEHRDAIEQYDDFHGRRSGVQSQNTDGVIAGPEEKPKIDPVRSAVKMPKLERGQQAPTLPGIDDSIQFDLGGVKYAVAVGKLGQFEVVKQAGAKPPFWSKNYWKSAVKSAYRWREVWRADTNILPPDDQKYFHFKLGRNQRHPNEDYDTWYARVSGNYQKMLGDASGLSMLYKFTAESIGKRLWHHEVEHVSGRFLGEAIRMYTDGITIKGHTPGEYNPDQVYSFSKLDMSSQLAVLKYLIEQGIYASNFEAGYLDAKRRKELIKEYAIHPKELTGKPLTYDEEVKLDEQMAEKKVDPFMRKVVEMSLRENKDWVAIVTKEGSRPERATEVLKAAAKMVVSNNGVVDLAGVVEDEKGNLSVHSPRGAQPFYIARWNIPTVSSTALRMMDYLPRYKPFVKPLVDLGIKMDTSAFELHTRERQVMKSRIMSLFHDGLTDDPFDIPLKIAATMGWDPVRAERMALVLHEVSSKPAGSYWDHLRCRVRAFQQALETNFSLEQLMSQRVNREPAQVLQAAKQRGNLIEMMFADDTIGTYVEEIKDAKAKHDSKHGKELRGELAKHIQETYHNVILSSGWVGNEGGERRFQDIAGFLINHYDLMRMVLSDDVEGYRRAVQSEKDFYKAAGSE